MKVMPKNQGPAPCIDEKARGNSVWATLTPKEVELFNRKAVCRSYAPGETIFHEGDACKGLYLINTGLVGVRKVDIEGRSSLVRLAGKGDTLGYRPFLAKQSHRASAEVLEAARVCFIDAPTVRRILQDNHALGLEFLERTARALGAAEDRLFEMAVLNVDTRIVHLLVMYHDQWGRHLDDGSVSITVPLTRDDMASMIGAHPDSVTRAIRRLESRGLVQADGRLFRISAFDLLAEHLHTDLAAYH